MVSSEQIWLVTISLFLLGALTSLMFHKKPHAANIAGHSVMFLGSVCGFLTGVKALVFDEQLHNLQIAWLPFSYFDMRVDGFAAFFICVVTLLSAIVSIYAIGYVREYYGRHNIGLLAALSNLFVLSMLLVIAGNNAIAFLVSWEMMSLISYFLVVYEQRGIATIRAGFIYIVMTHVGTAAIMALFLLFFSLTGSFQFAVWEQSFAGLTPFIRNVVFLLALLGFGTKAGLVPVHIWLPIAHPTAPSYVSALMSGVMVKTAVYAFLRMIMILGGAIPPWWGGLLIVLGVASAVIGVMYALVERDVKRLLAYSTVENVGIIFTGIGVLFTFQSFGSSVGAAVAAMAVLFHILGHSIFKGLLFMAAGSVVQACHTQDMDQLGGLIKSMPQTAFAFFIGVLSVSALPPFNGFVSEWLLLQNLFQLGIYGHGSYFGILAPVSIALLGLVGALVIAGFVKIFGVVFLAQPRSRHAMHITETSLPMRGAMFFAAAGCLLSGLLAPWIIQGFNSAVFRLTGEVVALSNSHLYLFPFQSSVNGFAPMSVAGVILLVIAVLLAVDRIWGCRTKIRIDETWGCGIDLTSRMEYTGTSFSQPLKIIFRSIFMPERSTKREFMGSPYFTHVLRYHSTVTPVFERFIYRPLTQLILTVVQQMRRIQTGRLQIYLGYIFATLVLLLLYAK